MLDAICLIIAWISLIISLSLFSFETLKQVNLKSSINQIQSHQKALQIEESSSTKNLPFFDNLSISLDAKVPPL